MQKQKPKGMKKRKKYKVGTIRLKQFEVDANIRGLRKKNLTAEQIKTAVEFVMNVDLETKSRTAHVIKAKAIFYYIARMTGKKNSDTSRVLGYSHATAKHHFEKVRTWLRLNDEEIQMQIDDIFGTKFYVPKKERELNKLTKYREVFLSDLIGVVNSIPLKDAENALERFKAIAKSYNFKRAETETKVFTGTESMSDYCF